MSRVIDPVSCRLQALFVIGSAKVRKFSDFPNSKRNFFKFFVFDFFQLTALLLKRGAKVRWAFPILQGV